MKHACTLLAHRTCCSPDCSPVLAPSQALGLGIVHETSTSAEPVLAVADSIDRPIRQRHTVIAVSAGSFHSLLVTSIGTAYSFGSGDNGRLGHGDTSNKFTPSLIAGEPPSSASTPLLRFLSHFLLSSESGTWVQCQLSFAQRPVVVYAVFGGCLTLRRCK